MSCEDCEKNKNRHIAYYRIDNANIAIVGCDKHIKMIIDKLNSLSYKEFVEIKDFYKEFFEIEKACNKLRQLIHKL